MKKRLLLPSMILGTTLLGSVFDLCCCSPVYGSESKKESSRGSSGAEAVKQSPSSAKPPKVRALRITQLHYALGEEIIYLAKDAIKIESHTHDANLVARLRDGSVIMYSVQRKLKFRRSLRDFITKGSDANWTYSDMLSKAQWLFVRHGTYCGTSADLFISPKNPRLLRSVLKGGTKVDLEKHAAATAWAKADAKDEYWQDGIAVLYSLYRLSRFGGIPLSACYSSPAPPIFWERSLSAKDRKQRNNQAVKKEYLTTKSITTVSVDPEFFYEPDKFKSAKDEQQVYISPQLEKDLEEVFFEGGDKKRRAR